MSDCKVDMMKEGIECVPRSCYKCGLGPCRNGYSNSEHKAVMDAWCKKDAALVNKPAFTKAQLVELRGIIQDAVETKKILVPSTDYYARRGDFEEENLKFIDAWKLEDALNRAINEID